MKVDILLGLQWGDEGKGKIVDFLAPRYHMVARFQGGPNAGHTLEFDGIKQVLHQIPSGIFRENILNLIGNGVVLDPQVFREEAESIAKFGINVKKNLFISKKAQLILPTHRLLDAAHEQAKGFGKIGSTLRGIGPAYEDKVARVGIRVGDILEEDFKSKFSQAIGQHVEALNHLHYTCDREALDREFLEGIEYLKQFNLVDGEYFIDEQLKKGLRVLAEGAQGSMLDLDMGSYPFVTSSNTIAAGTCTGLGLAPSRVGRVMGIFKAYCTRVGSGPFPTELNNPEGERLREIGKEYGATTGRPRRCGWLDIQALKYAIMLSGVDRLFMMKADVLSHFDAVKVCTHYRLPDGTLTQQVPHNLNGNLAPVLRSFPGWKNFDPGNTSFEKLPGPLLEYIRFLEHEFNVPIELISVGPDRHHTILKNKELIAD